MDRLEMRKRRVYNHVKMERSNTYSISEPKNVLIKYQYISVFTQIKVIMGGGRQKFTPKGVDDPEGGDGGKREDGKNLIQIWLAQKTILGNASYVWHRDDFLTVDTANTDYLLGLFDWGHMEYAIENDLSNPSLEEMTKSAIEILQNDPNGYFLFVE
ncbi:hypothetical protein SK128_006721, partial [Halocaridina rubra]